MRKKFIQVYSIWVNGRDCDDENQHFPIDSNCEIDWHMDFNRAYKDYTGCFASDSTSEGIWNSEIYSDYIVILYSIDIEITKFENMFDLDFDINCDECQEMMPYYCDYDLNTVAEKIKKFV